MKKKIILIDFDTVIANVEDATPKTVVPKAAEAIAELRKANYEVHVFSRSVAQTATVEKFLQDNGIGFDKVLSVSPFDILVSTDAVHATENWKWTLEGIVMHQPAQKTDTAKEIHQAMMRYKRMAAHAHSGESICC